MIKVNVDKKYLKQLEEQNLELRQRLEEAERLKDSIYKIESSVNISRGAMDSIIGYKGATHGDFDEFVLCESEKVVNHFSEQIRNSVMNREMGHFANIITPRGDRVCEISLEVVAPVLKNKLDLERKRGIQ